MPATVKDGAFVVFRTFEGILDGHLFDNDLTPTYFPRSHEEGPYTSQTVCEVAFTVEDFPLHLSHNQTLNSRSQQLLLHFPGIPNVARTSMEDLLSECQETSFHQPHRHFTPKILQSWFLTSSSYHYSVFQGNHSFTKRLSPSWSNEEKKNAENLRFVTPKQRCVVIVDAHVASCLKTEFLCSGTYFGRFLNSVRRMGGFKKCSSGHEHSTVKWRTTTGYHFPVRVMIEVFIVWPCQKIDHSWSVHVLGLLNKHVVLEEGLAWLSTLGGAHSSLGEKFLYHAERAGEISAHQMRLAKELGNEIMIARCYLYWSWSLLQRHYLNKCKVCVINTWKYCHQLRCRDKVLENMCKAVWTRLKYEKSLRRLRKSGKFQMNGTNHSFDKTNVVVCVR